MPVTPIRPPAFAGRRLTRKELSRADAYVTLSPKQKTIVEITSVLCLAFWLEREFDPNTLYCVPRPRELALPNERKIEVDFWTCDRDGKETFWVAVGEHDIESSPTGVMPRDIHLWDRAAQTAGITLEFIFEHQLERRAQRVATYLRLLPHVQAARRNPRTYSIGDRILELFGLGVDCLIFSQIESALREFDCVDIRTAVCVLIHAGKLGFNTDRPFTNFSPLHKRKPA
jgi:hypothetical protein